MKTIIGRYVLTGDYKNEFSGLPKDFIDLDKKTIIWHSDAETDNVLKLEYDDIAIRISILKSKNSKVYNSNSVRIRTSGSSYGCYYQEFISFFSRLRLFTKKQEREKGIYRIKTKR